jgi:hypothetical protein
MMQRVDQMPHKYLVRQPFTGEEDLKLRDLVENLGDRDWSVIADFMGNRTSRQCKERWVHYLAPNIIVSNWSEGEDELLLEKVGQFGRKWRQIEPFFPGRPDISLKNRYNVLQRRVKKEVKKALRGTGKIQALPSISGHTPSPPPVDTQADQWQPYSEAGYETGPLGEIGCCDEIWPDFSWV